MKKLVHAIAALSILCSASAVSAAEQRSTIPARFQGEWNANLKNCGQPGSESQLWIRDNELSFFESVGLAKAIVTQGTSDLALILESSGEGESWISYHHFRLSPDQTSLSRVADDGFKFVRYRCPVSR